MIIMNNVIRWIDGMPPIPHEPGHQGVLVPVVDKKKSKWRKQTMEVFKHLTWICQVLKHIVKYNDIICVERKFNFFERAVIDNIGAQKSNCFCNGPSRTIDAMDVPTGFLSHLQKKTRSATDFQQRSGWLPPDPFKDIFEIMSRGHPVA